MGTGDRHTSVRIPTCKGTSAAVGACLAATQIRPGHEVVTDASDSALLESTSAGSQASVSAPQGHTASNGKRGDIHCVPAVLQGYWTCEYSPARIALGSPGRTEVTHHKTRSCRASDTPSSEG